MTKKNELMSHSPFFNKIACILAQHYGFTDVVLDFIINYDIKYRMGMAGSSN